MTSDPLALVIMLGWLIIWAHMYWGGPKKSHLPDHPRLVFYTSMLGGSFFVFFSSLFIGAGAVTVSEAWQLYVTLGGTIFWLGGMYLVLVSRHALKNASYREVLFALNDHASPHAIYTYFKHPMYVGMLALLLGSLLWFPNIVGLGLVLIIAICLYEKVRIEDAHHRP